MLLFVFFVFPGVDKPLLGGVTQIYGPGLNEVALEENSGKILHQLTFLQRSGLLVWYWECFYPPGEIVSHH